MMMQNVLLLDKDIHYGEVIRHWRKEVIRCPVGSLLEVYNETFGTDHSRRWWERMEKENKLPTDIDRRLVIAAMLNIPFADLGLKLPPTEKIQPLIPFLTRKTVIDVSEYRNHLALLWSSKYEKAEEAIYRVNLLEDALHYGPQPERLQVAELLCEYLLFWSNVEHRSTRFSSAINMANKALRVAKDRNLPYLAAKAHYMRGSIAHDRWPTSSQRNQDVLARIITDLGNASVCLKEAKRGGALEAAILAFWGGAAVLQAQDLSDKHLNLKKCDLAVRVLEKSASQDPFFFKIDQNWLQLGQAEALIGAKWPQSALAELEKFPSGNVKKLRRFLTAAIVEAEAYRVMDKIDVAIAHASAALETAKHLRAELHIARIDALYRDMRSEEKYKSSTELMRFGIEIVKAQYPQFF